MPLIQFLTLLLLALALVLNLAGCRAQVVIAAPDKGDELEQRAYVEAQSALADTIRHRDPNATIDTNVYTMHEPTQYAIGLLLDPCRDHAPDCCSDRFGEPAYTTVALSAKEKISLLDESGAPLDVSASRLSDRPSLFDADCYVDASLTPFRLTKTLFADGVVVSKNYSSATGCVGRLRALAPMRDVTMPPCWDHNDTVDALASCVGWDGRRKNNCVAVAYMQTAYIVQCFGAFALDNHCGTFLELHEPGSETIVSQTRLLGEYPSGFRTTTLPLTFRGDRARTVCAGQYELWWVQRTRYNFVVQRKKALAVVAPPCDFDFATNTYKNYHVKVVS